MEAFAAGLALKAVGVLAPLLKRGAESVGRSVGVAAVDQAQEMLGILRQKLADDDSASTVLSEFEKDPETNQHLMTKILEKHLAKDSGFASQIDELLKQVGPKVDVFQKMDEADHVLGAEIEDAMSGQINVDQDIKKAKDVTGVKIKKLGS